jgi:hypothetical protein
MKGAFVVLGTIAAVLIGFAVYQQQATQVLMVGNSYTYGNDLGGMIEGPGDAGGNPASAASGCPPACGRKVPAPDEGGRR